MKSSKKPQIKKFYKTDPPKVGILIQNTISKFSKPKFKLKKDPLKFQKIKNIYKEASNQKVLKTDPPKNGNSDSKYNFGIFKNQKSNSKQTPTTTTTTKNLTRFFP